MTEKLLNDLKLQHIKFSDVLTFIETHYHYTATAFTNGDQVNLANQNQGSAKVFAFAQLNNLNQAQTLSLFAEHFKAVCQTPDGIDHQNIRQFMLHGWSSVSFEGPVLVEKSK